MKVNGTASTVNLDETMSFDMGLAATVIKGRVSEKEVNTQLERYVEA